MPMDYDGNDISNHNLQLASEAKSKSSSSWRPYDFPKFDFDDNLQGHLRFDSLVETEVFLGIQSQGDNQWIEDFSRVSNGMEFNPTPVDSCSISRRNNVWSEATSSESVEMLLKSVGQDEMTRGTSIIHESDAITDQETLSKVVVSNNIKIKEGNDDQDEVLKNDFTSSGHIEEPLANPSKDEPLCGISSKLNQNSLFGNGGKLGDESDHSYHSKSINEILEESTISVEKTMYEGDSLAFPSTSKGCQQIYSIISHENCSNDRQDKNVTSKTELNDTVIHTCNSERESQEEKIDSARDSVVNLVKGEFEIQNKKPENASIVINETDKRFDKSEIRSSMDVVVQDSAEFGSISSENRESPEQLINPTSQLPNKEDSDNMKDISSSPSKCKSVSEKPLLSIKVNEASIPLSEGTVDHERLENSEGCLKDTIAPGKDSIAHLVDDDMNVPMPVSRDKLGHKQAGFSESDEKDMCKTTVVSKEMTCDLVNMDTENIGTLKNDENNQLLGVREGLDVDADKLMPQSSGKLELDEKGSTSTSIKDSTPSVDHPEIEQRVTTEIELHSNNYQRKDGVVSENLQVELDNTSKVGVSVVLDNVRNPSSEISAVSQQPVEKIDDICISEPLSKDVVDPLSLDCKKSSLKESADLASGGETMAKEEAKESGQTGEIEKTSCGSPTIISSSEPSRLENDNQEEGRGYENANSVEGIQSTSKVVKRLDSSVDDCGFTFKVNALPDTIDQEPKKNWSPFPNEKKSLVLEETSPSGKCKTEKSPSHKTPPKNAKIDGETSHGVPKGTSEREGRQESSKGNTKENVKKGNKSKSPNQKNSSSKVENASNSSGHYGNVSTSNLPDLNASTMSSSIITSSSSFTSRQHFSDLQQVQLRAQIFVYGSLIQGHVPDEAFMVSAFGQYEGGRNFWEQTWRAATERAEKQKSSSTAVGTPRSQSSSRVSDALKLASHACRLPATPTSKAKSKETPTTLLSPIVPLPSPLWNTSTPSRDILTSNPIHKGPNFQQALTPVHPYHTPQIRNFVSQTSLSSQTVFPSPWLAPPQTSSFSSSVQFRPVTMTETVKLTPVKVKDTSVSLTSTGKDTISSATFHTVGPSPALGISLFPDPKSISSTVQKSVDSMPRKRKKVPASNPSQPIISTVSPIDLPEKSNLESVKDIACSEETLTLTKVAEAQTQSEEAEAFSNAAVKHCEDLWGQLTKQKVSGLTLETEAKLASAAAAVAAAASVAKAAAAAARTAWSAAVLQARQNSENALLSSGKSSSNSFPIQSSFILIAENLDAIVKAPELAASAVAQAGKIVEMGDPLLLNELIEAGPEGYWKLPQCPQPSFVLKEKVRNRNIDQSGGVSSDKAGIVGKDYVNVIAGSDGLENSLTSVGILGSKHGDEKELRTGIDHEGSDTSKSCKGAREIDGPLERTNIENDCDDVAVPSVDGITEGSRVEVFNPRSAQKSAWYTANVISVDEGKAYVCYNDLLLDKGSGNVQEWVPLGIDEKKAPIIRITHPLSTLPYQQTRKRRRANLGDYVWCVGDRVDVWIDDCWWEGVVTEKNEKDETTIKVHLSAQGQTHVVRAWNIRASRSWIDGKWIECSPSKGQNTSVKSDTPNEKRQKLDSFVSKSKDKEPNNLNSTLEKPEQFKLLNLSTSERTFDIVKTTTINDNKHAPHRPLRTNLQKEGSRVVFGVPKPTGKKRKFMEVSKHFSTNNKTEKNNGGNELVKFAKYLMPQGAPSQGWKVPTKIDSKDKRIVELKPRVLRNLPQRDNTRSKSTQDLDFPDYQGNHVENSVNRDESTSVKSVEHEESTEAPLSCLVPQSVRNASKRIPSLNSRTERVRRGRSGISGEKSSKVLDKVLSSNIDKSTLDVSEPRRSNRQIQPTHRLLEGLESSMVIPKMPAVSHDKSRRNLPRGK